MEVVPSRVLNLLYVVLDIGFLVFLAGVLLACKRYAAALFGVFAACCIFWSITVGFTCCLGRGRWRGRIPSGFCCG